jgi:hypothetical protein
MGRRGGQAAFGSSLFWSYTCFSNFDVSTPSPLGRAAATASPTLQHGHTTATSQNQMKFRESQLMGQKFEGGKQRILWERKKFKKRN